MFDVIADTLTDAVKLLPFLFITYLAMEYIEHKMGENTKRAIEKSGRFGPLFGGIIGAFPQCGFSAAASNLYAGRIITLGTLIAVFLSTSDEMLPILLSEQVGISVILKLVGMKMIIGMAAGFFVDLFRRQHNTIWRHNTVGQHSTVGQCRTAGQHNTVGQCRTAEQQSNGWRGESGGEPEAREREAGHMDIGHVCEHEHCHCEDGIFRSALRHTANIFFFILVIAFVLNTGIHFIGEDFLARLILNKPVLGQMIAGLVGLIPNCASSVILTQLYLEGVMGLGAMMSGLLAGTGVGLLVLFRVNDNRKENAGILVLLYIIGVTAGVLIDAVGLVI